MGSLKRYALIVSAIVGTIELLSYGIWGVTVIISRIPDVYAFVVSVPYLSPTITFLFGILVGMVAMVLHDPEPRISTPEEIEGCIEKDNVHWRFSTGRRNRKLRRFHVSLQPYCSECKTKLEKTKASPIGLSTPRPFWECADCGEKEDRSDNARSEVEQIARKHAERIIETRGQEYSLDTLAQHFYEQNEGRNPAGKDIWQLYVDQVDDDFVTTACFHDEL